MENTQQFTESIEQQLEDMNRPSTSKSECMPPPQVPKRPTTKQPNKTKIVSRKAPTESYDLKGVVNLLILIGLTSVNLWEKVIFDVRKKVSDMMNPDLTALYFHLKMVSNTICTGIAQTSDLSQEKLEMINELDRDYDEIMLHADPVLQVYSKNKYSVDIVRHIKEFVLEAINQMSLIEISDDDDDRTVKSKKRAISDDDHDDDSDKDDELFELFSKKCNSKKRAKKLAISQQVLVKNDSVTRKCITPGETGKYLIKIEITDCEDLKGVKPTQYWTKIWKKAVFLVNNDKDQSYTAVNNVWANESKRILQIKECKVTEFEEDEDKDVRKRGRFFR